MIHTIKSTYLSVLNRTLNPLTLRAARSGLGPFCLVRHVGRKTGRTYETPLILAPVPGGFVAALTYGPDVSWLKNITAAGTCEVVVKGVPHHVTGIDPMSAEDGLRAFGVPAAWILRLARRHEFRLLRSTDARGDDIDPAGVRSDGAGVPSDGGRPG